MASVFFYILHSYKSARFNAHFYAFFYNSLVYVSCFVFKYMIQIHMNVPYIKKSMHAEEYQPYNTEHTVKFHLNRLCIYSPPKCRSHYGPGVNSASNRNEYQVYPGGKGGRCVRLTTYHHIAPLSRNLGALISLDPSGPAWPVTGVLYLYPPPKKKINMKENSVAKN
jgi:hypothetical protein